MVKSYLRYEHSKTFGVVTSSTANPVWTSTTLQFNTSSGTSARSTGVGAAVVPANEEVLVWDIKKGDLLARWKDDNCKSEVTVIAQSKLDKDVFAVGYSDGSIRIWDGKTAQVVISFNGHRSGVSALAFDRSGTRLASGGKDAHIIVWDLIAEVGLYRLKGHKDQITSVQFLSGRENTKQDERDEEMVDELSGDDGWLLTTGKDTFIKLWDLSTQHCMETHVAHHGECWGIALSPDEKGCITAGNDGELKVWAIDSQGLAEGAKTGDSHCLLDRGYLHRASKERGVTVTFHPSSNYIATHGMDKSVEIWRIRSEDEIRRSLKRKRKRKAEKAKADGVGPEPEIAVDDLSSATVEDIFVSYVVIRAGGKVRGIDWATPHKSGKSESIQLLVSLTNNSLEYYDIPKPPSGSKEKKTSESPEYKKLYSIELAGHRSDVRSLALSSDDRMLASASSDTLKIWNVKTATCIRTFDCGYALCCSFLPGDKIVVVGTKNGELKLFDVASSVMLESINAHDSSIWSLQVHPDGKSLVTASADKSAKFWNFEVVQEEIPGTKRTMPRLKLVHKRTLKVNDHILSVRYTPNGKLIAVALLDNTVKVFFADTLKQLHNLYGHKLPVLNMDISSDSKLIATCSADKNVKIWGLDFGDCHKSFFAHQDSIMQVAFERDTHNFFSASKDRLIKYWDGDKFENIQKMEGHHGEIWAMAVGRTREFIVTASHDKSIRVWEQGEDQIFLEEEREKELEELYETTLTASLDPNATNPNNPEDPNNPTESASAGKQTAETLMAGERIMESLQMGVEDLDMLAAWHEEKKKRPNLAPPQRHPVYVAMGGISAERHLAGVIGRIKAAHLQDALLVLPFAFVEKLLRFLDIWAEMEYNIPLTSRILFSLLRIHHRQIVSSKTMRPMLDSVRIHLRKALTRQKDEMGYNLAALRYVLKGIKDAGMKEFEDVDAPRWDGVNGGGTGKKRAFASLS